MFVIATPGTFDIDFVNYSIIDGGVYITVQFVEGSESHSFSNDCFCGSKSFIISTVHQP